MTIDIYPRPQKIDWLTENASDWKETYKDILQIPQAYVLKIGNEIEVAASDEEGFYYGNLTLQQLLGQYKKEELINVVIADYPSIQWRGVIEGFYGTPWTQEERFKMIEDISKYKMNMYVYAPKDDPYHRAKWREFYPEKEQEQLKVLAEKAKAHHVQFCWTIHPGDTMQFTQEDLEAAIQKMENMYELGIRQFGILFDDITHNQDGKLQAEFINQIDDLFVRQKEDVKPLIMVGTRYCAAWGPDMDSYFKPLVENLHDQIHIMWTGENTMSDVSKDIFEWPKKQVGSEKNMAVWWNYPVNDYCTDKVFVGPMKNLANDLDNVELFLTNPMNQAEASKISVCSIADYCWNVPSYDYEKSWRRFVEKFVPEAKEAFQRFATGEYVAKDYVALQKLGNESLQKELNPFFENYYNIVKYDKKENK